MAISGAIEPITASDDEIGQALADAFLPALLPALAQATGNFSLLREELRPPSVSPAAPQGGMSDEHQAIARGLAFEALRRLRDGGLPSEERDLEGDVRRISAWMTAAAPASDEYIPRIIEELAPNGQDPRAPTWHANGARPFTVAIIGAGMSGILAALRLQQAGIRFIIFEKNEDVGGTWLENTYPGARVDVASAFYSYSFAQKADWPHTFSTQDSLLAYFQECADEYGLRESIRFGSEVSSVVFDDARAVWALTLKRGGSEETFEAQAVISAVGQLNRPKMPDIAGMSSFEGPSFHSARWDHDVDLRGKCVAVIGTGASAAQFIPIISKEAERVDVYQRTANWFVPVPNYHEATPGGQRWLFMHVPHYLHWYRFWLFWITTDGLLPSAMVDEAWSGDGRSVSDANDQLRVLLTMYLQSQYADRPDLFEKVLPHYPPGAKRILLDNGIWAETMKRENVHLITDGIQEITPRGVRTIDGEERPADIIVYGTGFQASHFLTPMQVCGRNGVDLNEQWSGVPRAFLGITVPNFPNFFMLYGPNTNLVVNGSIIYFAECQVQYILGCLRLLIEDGHRTIECKQDVHDSYNERIDRENRLRAWGASSVNSWYKNAEGHVTQNWPFNLIQYWQETRAPEPAHYELA